MLHMTFIFCIEACNYSWREHWYRRYKDETISSVISLKTCQMDNLNIRYFKSAENESEQNCKVLRDYESSRFKPV